MIAYCFVTGARVGVLVVPSGHVEPTRAFTFRDGRGGPEVRIHVVRMTTDGASVAAWGAHARAFAEAIVALAVREVTTSPSERTVATPAPTSSAIGS